MFKSCFFVRLMFFGSNHLGLKSREATGCEPQDISVKHFGSNPWDVSLPGGSHVVQSVGGLWRAKCGRPLASEVWEDSLNSACHCHATAMTTPRPYHSMSRQIPKPGQLLCIFCQFLYFCLFSLIWVHFFNFLLFVVHVR